MNAATIHDITELELQLETWEALQSSFAETQWAWPRWFPLGYCTMLAAAPGVGKSLLALTACKLIAKGGVWPDGHEQQTDPYDIRRILWIETESGEPFHVGRASNIDLPLSHVVTPKLTGEADRQFTLSDSFDRQRIETVANLPSIAMVVVDSLSGGHTMDENSSQTGSVMQWLSSLAKKTGKPFLVVHHMNKSGMAKSDDPPTLSAIRGSTALLQHARVIWTLDCPDATRSSELRLACAKSNLAQKPKPIRIDIDTLGRLQWLGGYESPHDKTDRMIRDCAKQNPHLTPEQIAQAVGIHTVTVLTVLKSEPPSPTIPTFEF